MAKSKDKPKYGVCGVCGAKALTEDGPLNRRSCDTCFWLQAHLRRDIRLAGSCDCQSSQDADKSARATFKKLILRVKKGKGREGRI